MVCSLSQLYEYYNTGNDGYRSIYDIYWCAQTFTVGSVGHTITSVKLMLRRSGSPGTVYVGIRAVDGSGHPTGGDLTSGTTNGNTLPVSPNWEMREIALTEFTPSVNTQYAIVVHQPSADQYLMWALSTAAGYGGGAVELSFNSGSSWTTHTEWDFMFEVWGNPLATAISVSDSGVGTEAVSIQVTTTVSETGAGTETEGIEASVPCLDEGIGAEAVTVEAQLSVSDEGLASEYVLAEYYLDVQDSGLGAEFVWRLKNYCRIDSFDLPHVLSIKITDEAAISDKKIQGGSLPRRKMTGKPGRVTEIEGWTDSQSDIDSMEALVDGAAHVFLHPSGDSFAVRVKDFDPDRNVDEYDRRVYRMTLVELRTW